MSQHNTNEQHPFNEESGKYMAHCVECGAYVDDTTVEPPADFLCETCEFGEERTYL